MNDPSSILRQNMAHSYGAALRLLKAMDQDAFRFKCAVMAAERRFFQQALRMGRDFDPDELERQLTSRRT